MIDGTRTTYLVDLIYHDDESGEDFHQGVTVLRTDYLPVAEAAKRDPRMLRIAKDIKRVTPSGSKSRLAGPATAYRLRIRRSTRTLTTTLEAIH